MICDVTRGIWMFYTRLLAKDLLGSSNNLSNSVVMSADTAAQLSIFCIYLQAIPRQGVQGDWMDYVLLQNYRQEVLTGRLAIVCWRPACSRACQIRASPSMLSNGSRFALIEPEKTTGSCMISIGSIKSVTDSRSFDRHTLQYWGRARSCPGNVGRTQSMLACLAIEVRFTSCRVHDRTLWYAVLMLQFNLLYWWSPNCQAIWLLLMIQGCSSLANWLAGCLLP